jgi:hypothetical protein
MMMMMPSTACSPKRVNAIETSPCVGCRTGSSVIEYPALAAAMATESRVRMFPKEDRVNMMMPIFRNCPDRSARAALLGRYPSLRIAASTRLRVSLSTFVRPVDTRDTV